MYPRRVQVAVYTYERVAVFARNISTNLDGVAFHDVDTHIAGGFRLLMVFNETRASSFNANIRCKRLKCFIYDLMWACYELQ
jgi:hypothetical protein